MLETLFYIAASVALLATIAALTRPNAAHALIYLIVSLLAVAVLFFLMGAPFAAALAGKVSGDGTFAPLSQGLVF